MMNPSHGGGGTLAMPDLFRILCNWRRFRFGTVALTDSERAGLWDACSARPELLRMIVKELVKVTGVRYCVFAQAVPFFN